MNILLNKNILPNIVALLLIALSFLFSDPIKAVIFSTGLFALSGALTNWLAVHMLFERVPGLYGSGVIVVHFEQFKAGILRMVHEHLFNKDRVEQVLDGAETNDVNASANSTTTQSTKANAGKQNKSDKKPDVKIDLKPIVGSIDLDVAYDQLVETVMESSFGSMLGMLGGETALEGIRDPFKRRMAKYLEDVADSPRFQKIVNDQVANMATSENFMARLDAVLRARLDELTPEMVRDIMQQMIRKHLGWLVVWGGVFGGLIGLVAGLVGVLT